MKLSLIVENKTFQEHIHAEHGLALLIETDEKTILFDSGESDALMKNAMLMGVDLSKVDFALLSHGHFDHSGGFPHFNQINPDAKIYLHKSAFKETYDIGKDGSPTGQNLGVQWNEGQKQRMEPNLVFTDGPVYITDNIVISGSIPEHMRETRTGQFLEKTDGGYELDTMDHEQFLIIKENGKLYVFSGCSHNGVVPVVEYARQLFPDHEIQLLFGGFHLYTSPYDQLLFDVRRISSLDVECFMPVHCTGLTATFKMKELLGDRCIILNSGDKLFY